MVGKVHTLFKAQIKNFMAAVGLASLHGRSAGAHSVCLAICVQDLNEIS